LGEKIISMPKYFIPLLLVIFFPRNIFSENLGKRIASVPFQLVGNYIVVETRVNDSPPLNLILDTGVRNTIITELDEKDSLQLSYSKTINLQGLGHGKNIEALMSDSNSLRFGKFTLKNRSVCVVKDKLFNLSGQIGTKVNGMLGADFFQDYVVQIDYSARRIRFYDIKSFIPPEKYDVMPMNINGRKMYVYLSVLETDTAHRKIKMLIDTGAELNAWFQTITSEALHIPERSIRGRIGEGFSGEIKGIFARVPQICLGNYCMKDPVVAFPDSASISGIMALSDRDGTIGSGFLRRFNLIFDYRRRNLYFKKNSGFKQPSRYNIAGVEIVQSFNYIPQTEVTHVWEKSPAEKAGFKEGDIILEIDGQKTFNLKLSEIKNYFETPMKRKLYVTLFRNGKTIESELNMKDRL